MSIKTVGLENVLFDVFHSLAVGTKKVQINR